MNPDDFLRRNFIDTNGDVAFICDLVLLAILAIPLDSRAGLLSYFFLLAFAIAGLPTNQIHQWAHSTRPPFLVSWLQQAGVILSYKQHQRHHQQPYDDFYCIAIGWLNKPLSTIQFFRRLESAITWLTGLKPREEDLRIIKEVSREQTNP